MTEGNQKRILLVEDEVLIAMVEAKRLEDEGYLVVYVTTGAKSVLKFSIS